MVELINESKLDLACGNNKKEGFKGIDVVKLPEVDYVVDLQVYPWPIESNSADEIYCSNYIEHIPHLNVKGVLKESNSFEEFKSKLLDSKDGLIDFFNEVYRILKPGGKITIVVPYYSSERAYGDPTHVRYIPDFLCYYLSKKWRDDNKLEHYGLTCDFDLNNDITLSYHISNELTLKSEEIRNKAFRNDWNAIENLMIELVKR